MIERGCLRVVDFKLVSPVRVGRREPAEPPDTSSSTMREGQLVCSARANWVNSVSFRSETAQNDMPPRTQRRT